ncbi:hypothetical protein [Sphingomonas sp. Leaf25]|uniref:hypothetical protein n=1 Tax=Sphingomonas sp. Leaf25 TaxID=1735692 RepID=UPI000A4245B6|nr:hypothetical protein [Sphingomonas sp. Leaf25]
MTQEGIVLAAERLAGIAERLKKDDYAGQVRDKLPGRGLRYWQREGFRFRLDS